ncbi:NAD+ synthase (glutamine-hydrolyzing) [Kineosphaera limosa]|uniref:Glutamine-dependent NAD(+) synthetase n=1 Tax=Kineosphaera limosa NBRC 100340 TaxID=1184609 RepID=K6VMW9_9MICO|nr:NAD(+) synthase [Kineosphaera limosa]NYE00450.1 NAD+ synthase (glutamine-hydrolyzing) [Kineosphaera limosa]GAB97573.1 glutamine-dependent NAD(+) synthetase [Kineosphaera limosa NBRC 100340]
MDFGSVYAHGFARVAAATMPIAIADPARNAETIATIAREMHDEGVAIALFPELCVSGYALEDLLLQDPLLDAVEAALAQLASATAGLRPVLIVGAPLRKGNRLYNCAVILHGGQILGVAPKSYLPTYREFYERRHFAPGDDQVGETIRLGGPLAGLAGSASSDGSAGCDVVPFGPDLLFRAVDVPGLVLHVEVCEDLWVPVPPSARAALAGATILANPSGSPITVTKAETRHLMCRAASARCQAAYVYAAAGEGESSTDLSWDGQTMIYERGELLAQTERFPQGPRRSVADVDLDVLRQERMRTGTFDDNRRTLADLGEKPYRTIEFTLDPPDGDIGLRRAVDRFPFVPNDPSRLAQDCYEAYAIQVSGLEQRLRAIGNPKVVIGVSGGLDSTQALIVAAKAMDRLGRPRSDILAYTMPGFATGEHTKNNALALCAALDIPCETLDIRPAAAQMLKDMGHPFGRGEEVYDVTFENVQAGLRTDYLFRIANHHGGIVLGTGDLSELALGWCTYGVGDQMSHYAVNTGVPKTLIQHLIRWVASSEQFAGDVDEVLLSILATEITPELVPTRDGETPQSTQASIGPYNLQDFTLFHVLRHGLRPTKIAFLAWHAWHDAALGQWPAGVAEDERVAYDLPQIRRWMEVFLKRYFAFSQFKRSALPNGPKVLAGGSLSPRGDWRAPSDGNARAWLADWERIPHDWPTP